MFRTRNIARFGRHGANDRSGAAGVTGLGNGGRVRCVARRGAAPGRGGHDPHRTDHAAKDIAKNAHPRTEPRKVSEDRTGKAKHETDKKQDNGQEQDPPRA